MSTRIPPFLAIEEEPLTDEQITAAVDEETAPWTVKDLDSAEWAMSKVADLDSQMAAIDDQHAAYLDRLDRWRDTATRDLIRRREWLAARLIEYAATLRDADPARHKSLSLPSGRVQSRQSSPAAIVVDHDAAAAWLSEVMPDVAEEAVTSRVSVREVRRVVQVQDADGELVAVTEDGEQIPGIDVADRGLSWSVTPG